MTETSPDRSLLFRIILVAAVVASMFGAVLMVLLGVKKTVLAYSIFLPFSRVILS